MSQAQGKQGDTSLGGDGKEFPRTTGGFLDGLAPRSEPESQAGFEKLCARYWKPVYFFVRVGWSKSNEEAKDLTQGFFSWLLESDALRRYRSERGAFRTFLKTLLRRYLTDQHRADHRVKRGGRAEFLSLDDTELAIEDTRSADPEAVFDEQWLVAFMKHCVGELRQEFEAKDRRLQLQVFEAVDLGPGPKPSHADLAKRLGVGEAQVRDALFAVRKAMRERMRAELQRQTRDPEEFEEEWRALLGI